jgi:hypothetical protein
LVRFLWARKENEQKVFLRFIKSCSTDVKVKNLRIQIRRAKNKEGPSFEEPSAVNLGLPFRRMDALEGILRGDSFNALQ